MNGNKTSGEFENFNRMMHKLIKVPHSKIKAKLAAEKVSKDAKNMKTKKRSEANIGDEAIDTEHNGPET